MYTGIFFSIEALFYLGLLLLVYFKKKVFKSRENKIYSILVNGNLSKNSILSGTSNGFN